MEETFFNSTMRFEDFADFEIKVLGATYTKLHLDDGLHRLFKERLERHVGGDGAYFRVSMRMDLLRPQL